MQDQIDRLSQGTIPVRLVRPCTVGDGIASLASLDRNGLETAYTEAQQAGRVTKMVPASGAATRMFRDWLNVLAELESGTSLDAGSSKVLKELETELPRYAFVDRLRDKLAALGLGDPETALRADPRRTLAVILGEDGLNLAALPKALVPFHAYGDHSRIALGEHLQEALDLGLDANGIARVHFTIADEAMAMARAAADNIAAELASDGTSIEITWSIQDPETDTIAIDAEGRVVHDPDGSVHKRPAGHGALLKNLAELGADIVTIKNIDNVTPDHLKPVSNGHRPVLGGLLVRLQKQMFEYLEEMDAGVPDTGRFEEMLDFARDQLGATDVPAIANLSAAEASAYLRGRFDRPLRVCGVVPNTGEPGGGPFWTADASNPKQIVESASVDMNDAQQQRLWESSTHFNPVDLTCGLRDYQGQPFDLTRFVDADAALVVEKSAHGKSIRALELPGLWNGAMARWNTVFVEVPLVSFNPAKTVFDLLRDGHQPV